MNKIALVVQGSWGEVNHGEYISQARVIKRYIESVNEKNKEEKRSYILGLEVKIFKDSADALKWLGRIGKLVFLTRGMTGRAKCIAQEYPRIRVMVTTGLIPEGEVVFVGKEWSNAKDLLYEI